MELRKRTENGKSTKHEMTEILRVVAMDKINNITTLSFELGKYHGTQFNITLSQNEKDELVKQLTK